MTDRIAWMSYRNAEKQQNDFLKVKIADEGTDYRQLVVVGGARDGETIIVPGAGIPFEGFHPVCYEQDSKPEVFWYKGRSLQKVDLSKYSNTKAAALLVPEAVPYEFPPHTSEVIDGIIARDHQLLSGKKGTGKTSIVEQIAARIGQPMIRINFTGQTTISDIVGSIGVVHGKGTVFNYGPVMRAMQEGYWCLGDEFDFGEPRVLSVFHSILEPKPAYCLKENDGEIVSALPGFRFFATANSIIGDKTGSYVGTNKMNAALLDRFSGNGRILEVKAMNAKQERKVLQARMPNLPYRLVKRVTNFASEVRVKYIDGFSTRELLNWCKKMVESKDPIHAARLTFLLLVDDEVIQKAVEDFIIEKLGKRIILGRAILPTSAAEVVTDAPVVQIRVPKAPRKAKTPIVETPKPDETPKPEGETEAKQVMGRTAGKVTDPAEMEKIWKLHKDQGGPYSWEQIEADTTLNLKSCNGMTAYRIAKKYEADRARSEGKAPPTPDDDNLVTGGE